MCIVKEIDLNIGGDSCSKYGVSDFYEESEAILAKALAGAEDFTAFGSSRKEPLSCSITRRDGEIECLVYQYMDEDDALVEDAFFHLQLDGSLLDDVIEGVLKIMEESSEFSNEADAYRKLPVTATVDEIKAALSSAQDETEGVLQQNFEFVCSALLKVLGSGEDVFLC